MQADRNMSIDSLIEQVKEKLKVLSYSEHTRKNLSGSLNNIRKYANSKGVEVFTEQLGVDFLKEKYNYPYKPCGRLCTTVQNASRAVGLLSSYQNTGEIVRRKKRNPKREAKRAEFQQIIEAYIESIRPNHRNQKPLAHHRNTICDFTDCLYEQGLASFSVLSANQISAFISTFIKAPNGSRKSKLYHMRFFLRFLYSQKHTAIDLSLAIPHLRLGGHKYVPEPFSSNETELFLSSIDRAKARGKRDYAIVQMISQLGMRSGDVRLLKFEHINWETGTLCFQQEKTSHPIELPMSEEVGLSLIDYLKNGRPESDSEYVFIRHSAPWEPLKGLTDICRRYMKSIKTPESKRGWGLHTFRHTLASRLLEKGVPTQMIAQILGHVNNDTVGEYLHIDFNKLSLCALDPEEVFVNEQF